MREYQSPSSLHRFEQCGHSYQLRYINNVERSGPGKPAQFGSYVHKVLSNLFEFVIICKWVGYLEEPFIKYEVKKAAEEFKADYVDVANCYQMISAYLQRIGPLDHSKILSTEKTQTVEIPGLGNVLCIIDRVDKINEDTIEIVDYKSGKDWNDYHTQIVLYIAATRLIYQWALNISFKLEFLKLKTTRLIQMSNGQLQENLDTIRKVKARIDNEMFDPSLGFHCKWCDVKQHCIYVRKSSNE